MKSKKDAAVKNDRAPASLSRRRFGQLAMMGLAGGALLPGELLLAKAPSSARESAAPAAPDQERGEVRFSAAARAEIEEKLQRIFAEYGDRLSADQKRHMRDIVSYHVQMLETVRAVSLENPDAPATVLKLVRAKRGAPAKPRRSAARSKVRKSAREGR